MRSFYFRLSSLVLLSAILLPAGQARKKVKPAAKEPQDSIEVVGHIPAAAAGSIARFLTTQHYSSYYLYAEHESGHGVTMIDVTRANRPSVVTDMPSLPGGSETLSVVAGTAALVTSAPVAATSATQTIRIMDFSDPQHPKVTREFAGVTATARDEHRGLIFVANPEGIWILQQHLAEDPEVEKAYANYVVYGSSMYPPAK